MFNLFFSDDISLIRSPFVFVRKKGASLVTCSEELIFRKQADLQQCYLEVVLAGVHSHCGGLHWDFKIT